MKKELGRLILLFITLCLILTSCSPWEQDLDRVYKAAQNNDKNAMFAVVIHYDHFNSIVPLDSFKRYQQILIESGNNKIITNSMLDEFRGYEKAHPNVSYEKLHGKLDEIALKWYYTGIKYNDVKSYNSLGYFYHVRYLNNHSKEDSIKAREYYDLAWKNWDGNERVNRDTKKGIFHLVIGGIKYSTHVYKMADNESFIPRMFNAGLIFSVYVMSGLWKLFFTSQWWIVLITILIITLILTIPMIVVLRLYTKYSIQRRAMKSGMTLGLWNMLLIFIAYCNANPNWTSNVGALWFSQASYGLQPYLCIIPNWLILLFVIWEIVAMMRNNIKQGQSVGKAIWVGIGIACIFLVNYLIAAVTGLFYIFLLILFFVVKVIIMSIPQVIEGLAGMAIPDFENLNKPAHPCRKCRYFNNISEYCDLYYKSISDPDRQTCQNYV